MKIIKKNFNEESLLLQACLSTESPILHSTHLSFEHSSSFPLTPSPTQHCCLTLSSRLSAARLSRHLFQQASRLVLYSKERFSQFSASINRCFGRLLLPEKINKYYFIALHRRMSQGPKCAINDQSSMADSHFATAHRKANDGLWGKQVNWYLDLAGSHVHFVQF